MCQFCLSCLQVTTLSRHWRSAIVFSTRSRSPPSDSLFALQHRYGCSIFVHLIRPPPAACCSHSHGHSLPHWHSSRASGVSVPEAPPRDLFTLFEFLSSTRYCPVLALPFWPCMCVLKTFHPPPLFVCRCARRSAVLIPPRSCQWQWRGAAR